MKHQRPSRIPSKKKRIPRDERSHVGADEEYTLSQENLKKLVELKLENRFTLAEIAGKLNLKVMDVIHDDDLLRREEAIMDE